MNFINLIDYISNNTNYVNAGYGNHEGPLWTVMGRKITIKMRQSIILMLPEAKYLVKTISLCGMEIFLRIMVCPVFCVSGDSIAIGDG